jgi:hypothetical protein
MSNIPEARDLIEDLMHDVANGVQHSQPELFCKLGMILSRLYRKPPIRKAERHSQPMTPELAAAIRAFANRNQSMPFQTIGQRFNVNAGRVTEVLQGEYLE